MTFLKGPPVIEEKKIFSRNRESRESIHEALYDSGTAGKNSEISIPYKTATENKLETIGYS